MTTITMSMTDTDHRSYSFNARTYIGQATFDEAMRHWRSSRSLRTWAEDSIFDGSEDVVYAVAWIDDEGSEAPQVHVTMIQYSEDAKGYPVDALPFFLDIEHAEPEPPAEPVEHFFMAKITSTTELAPIDLIRPLTAALDGAKLDIRRAY